METLEGLASFAFFCMIVVISAISVGSFILGMKLFGIHM